MIEEFKETIWSYTAHPTDQDVEVVKIMPNQSVAIKKAMLKDEEALKIFVEGIQQIPNISKGLSYKAMMEISGFTLTKDEVFIVIAIGGALDIWEISPMNIPDENMRNMYVGQDSFGLLPTTIGYSVQNAMAKVNEE